MEPPYVIVVITRFHANKGELDDEYVMEWLPGSEAPNSPVQVRELRQATVPESTDTQPAKLVLIHGNTGCGSGTEALRQLLVSHAKPELPAEGVEVRLYMHAHQGDGGEFAPEDFVGVFDPAQLRVLTYSGGGSGAATVNLLEKMQRDAIPDWIVQEVETLVHPGILGRQHLLKVREQLLRLWLDVAVVAAPTPEATHVQEAGDDLLEAYAEIRRRLRLGFWKTHVWSPVKDQLLFHLTRNRARSPASRGLQCWREFWGRQSKEAAKEAVAELRAGATSLTALEEDLTRLAASVDDLLVVAARFSPGNLEAEPEP